VIAGARLFLNGDALQCVTPADGQVVWRKTLAGSYRHFSVGDDFFVMRPYGGHGAKVHLVDGKDDPTCRELGGAAHACSPVSLTRRFAFAVTVGGLHVRDLQTGELLWLSPGFAPRGCVNPALADGRVFWNSAGSGTIFCWEPDRAEPSR
jgi:outer membrane protein assembly factor BamB